MAKTFDWAAYDKAIEAGDDHEKAMKKGKGTKKSK